MGASYPKPDDERRNRVEPRFGWVNLPAKSGLTPPPLPAVRDWSEVTIGWWAELWSKGQATQWDPSGSSALPMAVLFQDLQDQPDRSKVPGLLAEMRQHEDRHGLNPKAMLQLRWRITDDVPASTSKPAAKPKKATPRRARVLAIVPTDAS